MSAEPEDADALVIQGFLTDRVQPNAEEVFDAFVIVGIDPNGRRRMFYNVKQGEKGRALSLELAPMLASAIFYIEEQSNSSPQPGGGK